MANTTRIVNPTIRKGLMTLLLPAAFGLLDPVQDLRVDGVAGSVRDVAQLVGTGQRRVLQAAERLRQVLLDGLVAVLGGVDIQAGGQRQILDATLQFRSLADEGTRFHLFFLSRGVWDLAHP